MLALILSSGIVSAALDSSRRNFYDISLALGLKVEEIFITGRHEVPPEEISNALNVQRGDPILKVNLEDAHHQLLAIPWVERARIERHLPNILYVDITERTPYARWQYNKQMMLIDRKGVILSESADLLARFPNLPLVVGENANTHAAEILTEISATPFATQLRAAIRISDRRWDLRLAGKDGQIITFRLPELAPAVALQRLTDLWRTSDLANRGVHVVDARLPDRITLDETAADGKLDESAASADATGVSSKSAKPAAKSTPKAVGHAKADD